MRILGVAGSLHPNSANTVLLRTARALAPAGVQVELFEQLDTLPLFSPEHVEPPAAVLAWRTALAASDAVLLASPEYGHSLPGPLKNAIDWVIGSGELERKVVAFTAAVPAPERGRRGLAALEATLRAVSARLVGGVPIARGPTMEREVAALLEALVREVAQPEELTEPPFPEGVPLELLFGREGQAPSVLTAALRTAYGSSLGFAGARTLANFVTSLDGVVSLREGGESGQLLSQGSAADRFVMGLLRACASAVVLGAGTFRRAAQDRWTAEAIYPEGASQLRALRKSLGLPATPRFVLLTGSGVLGAQGPALEGALLVTTHKNEARLRASAPASATVLALDGESVSPSAVLAHLRAGGHGVVLSEGGPTLLGAMLRESCVDELFVTTSPVLYGRSAGDGRKGLVEGVDLRGTMLTLLSTHRHGSHLFHRYALDHAQRKGPAARDE